MKIRTSLSSCIQIQKNPNFSIQFSEHISKICKLNLDVRYHALLFVSKLNLNYVCVIIFISRKCISDNCEMHVCSLHVSAAFGNKCN